MTTAAIILASCLLAALAWIIRQGREIKRLERRVGFLEMRRAKLEREALEGEARSRGVGGTGEHAGAVVKVIGQASRVAPMLRSERFAIPTDRGK